MALKYVDCDRLHKCISPSNPKALWNSELENSVYLPALSKKSCQKLEVVMLHALSKELKTVDYQASSCRVYTLELDMQKYIYSMHTS